MARLPVGLLAPWICVLVFCDQLRADDPATEVKVPPGFHVTLLADEKLANDTYAMTLDSKGRVVVTTRGEVKTLHDDNGDGLADRATRFVETATGGMGLCFDGNDLMFCGDGWLSRYRDADGDGKADGPPERWVPLAFAEHGGHAMRLGPDGYWYVIGGNDAGIGPQHGSEPNSPIRVPEAGCLLRLSRDGKSREILAQGFRNPYDFDFNASGDLFTYDSDVERDVFLPWYAPTRVFHIAPGGHHGWRLTGFLRSWPRPGDDPGTVDILAPIGRGSPTGVVCYRHSQFPDKYRDGLFVLDWTFGKVYFVRLQPESASYLAAVEVFLEPVGSSGFAPTDAVVAPDGSLLISIGGRKTRGAVYRISHEGKNARTESQGNGGDLESVLRAPQPLDAWSRAIWEPVAERLGREPFIEAAAAEKRPVPERVRAIEILTERFGGIGEPLARTMSGSTEPGVRARLAWSLGRAGAPQAEILAALANDPSAPVRRAALEAVKTRGTSLRGATIPSVLKANLGHEDKRVRLSSASLATGLSAEDWREVSRSLSNDMSAERTSLLVDMLRSPGESVHPDVVRRLISVLVKSKSPVDRLATVRLLQRALGDYRLEKPVVEVLTAYSLQSDPAARAPLTQEVLAAVRPLFPSGHDRLDEELARLLAMLQDADPATPAKVASFWSDASLPTRDLHFLIVLACLKGRIGPELTQRVAKTVVALDGKLAGQEQRTKQSWNARLTELVTLLQKQTPAIAGVLVSQPHFVTASHVAIALGLPENERKEAGRKYLELVRDDDFPWSAPLIDLLGVLPQKEVRPLFRAQWRNRALRDALVGPLAVQPDEADREIYLDALQSAIPETLNTALTALEALPADRDPKHLVPLLRLLRGIARDQKSAPLRQRVIRLTTRQAGQGFPNSLATLKGDQDPETINAIFDWFRSTHPTLAARLLESGEGLDDWQKRLKSINWSAGDVRRGLRVFQKRGCQTCHDGPRALGPDLAGVTGRMARPDLFTAIVAPSLDVSPLYRTTLIETKQGLVHSGTIAFESADGLIVQTGATTTIRIANDDIATREPGTKSLMPERLLDGAKDQELADLDAFLRSLSKR